MSQAQSPRELLVLCPAAPGAAPGDGLCGEVATLLACPAGHSLSSVELCWTVSRPFANLGVIGRSAPGEECVSVWADCPSPGPPETRMQTGLGASRGSACFSLSLQSLEADHSITF